jgi:hypothetical protein
MAEQEQVIKNGIAEILANQQGTQEGTNITYTIPVVVHILYNDTAENVSDAVVQSAIDVLNEDYNRLNADAVQTPIAFRPYAANCEINFCLAKRTPDNQPTNGIERKYTTVTQWNGFSAIKYNQNGGANGWDPSKYLNIWVGNMADNLLGASSLPGGPLQEDGVVVHYRAFGRVGNILLQKYSRSRTLTHEAGHWLGLQHVWADDNKTCSGSDSIADTPNQSGEIYGCPSYPFVDGCTTSGSGVMFMNFLQYTDDGCMNLFTTGQKNRMNATINAVRLSVVNSSSCMPPIGIEEFNLNSKVSVYPNPAKEFIDVEAHFNFPVVVEIELVDLSGRICTTMSSSSAKTRLSLQGISPGMYVLRITTPFGYANKKVTVF